MGWEPEQSEWDKQEAKADADREKALVAKIKGQFGFAQGDTLIVSKRAGVRHTLQPEHLITQIVRIVQQQRGEM